LRHGIKNFEYQESILHAKTAVIDGLWATVGSSNLDRRSFRRNLEINAVVLDQGFGQIMEEVFFEDLNKSLEITLENFGKRRPFEFFLNGFVKISQYFIKNTLTFLEF
jgi:cardiolipin synthase